MNSFFYNKKKDQCSRHSIREDVLIQLVMDSLKIYSKMTDAIRSATEYLKENFGYTDIDTA